MSERVDREAFLRTAKRIKDASKGKSTMDEARKFLEKQLEKSDRMRK
tara:strand:+ start:380 stop:520 length:141 start_codon:yes stop_codon:yes gene_type:complete